MGKLFGRSFDSLGNSSSDLLLKTKGQVKIQWGNKFIDLIKDGNINYPKHEIKKLIEEIVDEKIKLQEENKSDNNVIPESIIVLFNGETIPENWEIIEDENLPKLPDGYKYIKNKVIND